MSSLEATILRTLVYFDLFSYPLTELEIWKWQFHAESRISNLESRKFELIEVVEVLEKSEVLNRLLDHRDGLYFLKGREEIVRERKKRYVISDQKLKRARFWVRFLQYAPFVEGIGICNSLGYYNARKTSDIDLFVIAAPSRIWTVRLFVTGFLKLFRLRPEKERSQDAMCPSFFLSRSALDMESLVFQPSDPHFQFWAMQVVQMYDRNNIFEQLFESNQWTRRTLPAICLDKMHPRLALRQSALGIFFRELIERILRFFPTSEIFVRSLQHRIMPDDLKRLSTDHESGVVISDSVLKFHGKDTRKKIRDQFKQKLSLVQHSL